MSCYVGVGTYLARVEFGTERGFKPREDLESKFSNNILENLEPFFYTNYYQLSYGVSSLTVKKLHSFCQEN